jgi:hypothetical protein
MKVTNIEKLRKEVFEAIKDIYAPYDVKEFDEISFDKNESNQNAITCLFDCLVIDELHLAIMVNAEYVFVWQINSNQQCYKLSGFVTICSDVSKVAFSMRIAKTIEMCRKV